MKMMMLWASVDPRLSTEPVTERNEIPGAAKLGKIYHFVWSVGTLDLGSRDQQGTNQIISFKDYDLE